MRELVIACSMLEDEVREAMRQTGRELPVLWIDRGLHEYPERLREELRSRIDSTDDAEVIMLTFALCGNALAGIGSKHAKLVLPKFDDCIHILTSKEPGSRGEVDCRTLYYTGGWLKSEKFIGNEFESCLRRYGPKKTKFIYDAMLKNYRSVQLLDTQSYDMREYRGLAADTAARLGLTYSEGTGSLRILKKLFLGEWDDEFLIALPGEQFRMEQFIPSRSGGA
ncbi:MAG: DUF1638 domain-containing protein [Bacillota bacterium]